MALLPGRKPEYDPQLQAIVLDNVDFKLVNKKLFGKYHKLDEAEKST